MPPADRDAFVPSQPDTGLDADIVPDASPPQPDAMPPEMDAGAGEPDAAPPMPDACQPQPEQCNGLDDDCDGNPDEDFDLASDLNHCGACNQACPVLPNTDVQCLARQCLVAGCLPGWRDENLAPGDGCEFPVVVLTLGPDDGRNVVRDTFEMTLEVEGVQHVDHLTVTVANEVIARVEADPSQIVELDLSARFEGETLLTVRAYGADDLLLTTETLFVIIDRTPPQLRIASPDQRTEIGEAPVPVVLEVTDLTAVTANVYVDDTLIAEFMGRPYEGTLTPTDFSSGPHRLRAEATDAAGNTTEAELDVSFIFCADAEMIPIPNLDVAIDAFEASRPDATADTEGENASLACSRPGVLPWREINYESAERACQSSGKRLCTQFEWELACGGAERRAYPYSPSDPDVLACNTRGHPNYNGLITTGASEDCATPLGVFDLAGNVAEWVAGRFGTGVSGGHYASQIPDTRCDAHLGLQGASIRPQYGFRCCQDL